MRVGLSMSENCDSEPPNPLIKLYDYEMLDSVVSHNISFPFQILNNRKNLLTAQKKSV